MGPISCCAAIVLPFTRDAKTLTEQRLAGHEIFVEFLQTGFGSSAVHRRFAFLFRPGIGFKGD